MRVCLNLDENFRPIYIPEGNVKFKFIKFSGGELHIKIEENQIDFSIVEHATITSRIKSSDDFMKVLIAKDALERLGIKNFDLIMPYIPYARQDRQCYYGESFTLKVFCNLLNSANFQQVHVLEQ